MPGQVRKTHIVFGSAGVSASPTSFYQFGSLANSSPLATTDIATIQALPAWTAGIQNEIYPANSASPYQEINAWMYEHSYQVGQIFQDGIAQYDAGTTYQFGSWVQDSAGRGQVFMSKASNSLGNAPPNGASDGNWHWMNPPLATVSGALAAGTVPKVAASTVGPPNSQALVASGLSDDGTYVKLSQPLKFSDNSVQNTAATSVVTAQNVVTGSRALNTVFQNTGGKPMFVSVTILDGSFSSQVVGYSSVAYTDSSNPPTTAVATTAFSGNNTVSASATGHLFFIVMPGNYYKVTESVGHLGAWVEWS